MLVTKHLTKGKPPPSRTGRGGGFQRGGPPGVEPEEARRQVGMASPGCSGKASIQPGNRERPDPRTRAARGPAGGSEPVADSQPCSHSGPRHVHLTKAWKS